MIARAGWKRVRGCIDEADARDEYVEVGVVECTDLTHDVAGGKDQGSPWKKACELRGFVMAMSSLSFDLFVVDIERREGKETPYMHCQM